MVDREKPELLKSNHPAITVDLRTGYVTAVSPRFMSELFPNTDSSHVIGQYLPDLAGDDAPDLFRAYTEIASLWKKYPRDFSENPGRIYDPAITPKIDGKRHFLALTPQIHGKKPGHLTIEFFDYTHILQDPLTGLQRRHTFLDNAEKMLGSLSRSNIPVSFMMIDIDSFKSINEEFGYAAGDDTLRTLGRVLLDQIRQGDQVCRYGGEEFAISEPTQNLYTTLLVGERIRNAIQQSSTETVHTKNKQAIVLANTASIGMTIHVPYEGYQTTQIQSLQMNAEIAMKAVKSNGKNGVGVYIDSENPTIVVFNYQPDGWYRASILDPRNVDKQPELYYFDSIVSPGRIFDADFTNISTEFFTHKPDWHSLLFG